LGFVRVGSGDFIRLLSRRLVLGTRRLPLRGERSLMSSGHRHRMTQLAHHQSADQQENQGPAL
jgi:hypothetical protein